MQARVSALLIAPFAFKEIKLFLVRAYCWKCPGKQSLGWILMRTHCLGGIALWQSLRLTGMENCGEEKVQEGARVWMEEPGLRQQRLWGCWSSS